jgi:hypothetical protein
MRGGPCECDAAEGCSGEMGLCELGEKCRGCTRGECSELENAQHSLREVGWDLSCLEVLSSQDQKGLSNSLKCKPNCFRVQSTESDLICELLQAIITHSLFQNTRSVRPGTRDPRTAEAPASDPWPAVR